MILTSLRVRLKVIQMTFKATVRLHLNSQCRIHLILNHCILVQTCGAYYSIMLYAHKFKLSNKTIHGLTKILHLFCPSPNSLPKSEYMIKTFFKQFCVPYKHQTVCTTYGVPCQKQCSTCVVPEPLGHIIHIPIIKHLQSIISSKLIQELSA